MVAIAQLNLSCSRPVNLGGCHLILYPAPCEPLRGLVEDLTPSNAWYPMVSQSIQTDLHQILSSITLNLSSQNLLGEPVNLHFKVLGLNSVLVWSTTRRLRPLTDIRFTLTTPRPDYGFDS